MDVHVLKLCTLIEWHQVILTPFWKAHRYKPSAILNGWYEFDGISKTVFTKQ